MTSLSQPVRVHNLTAWFIFAPPTAAGPARDYAVLEETIAAETAVLHETGTVNELLIENRGDLDLFIQAGDIVKGGRQDRTIGVDFIVPARSGKIPLPAYCVEHRRWHRRRDESDLHFSTAKDFLASKKARLAMRFAKSQAEVWESVAEEQEQLAKAVQKDVHDAESPTSLQLTYESEGVTSAIDDYTAGLEHALPQDGGSVVGVVWAINGVASHADQYASPQLFAKLWRKLLRSLLRHSLRSTRRSQEMSERPVLTLYPYLLNGTCWVFDDERTGLKEEAFVIGMTEMISRAVQAKGIRDAERGFAMTFSDQPFEGYDVELHWTRPDETSGNWYAGTVVGEHMEGWLCPALLLYFARPPRRIFVRCDPLPAGVNPIWTQKPGQTSRQFVAAPQAQPRAH